MGIGPSGMGGVSGTSASVQGGAGSVQYNNSAYGGGGSYVMAGMGGACRIIWGKGCSFPYNAGPSCFR